MAPITMPGMNMKPSPILPAKSFTKPEMASHFM
jgi:hypothetical protein